LKASKGKNLDGLVDPAWAQQQEKANNLETGRLEAELKGYKNNLIKESIRVSTADDAAQSEATNV
jgi:COP9 signalosome complex subunit 1